MGSSPSKEEIVSKSDNSNGTTIKLLIQICAS